MASRARSKSRERHGSPALSRFTGASVEERESNKKAYRDLTKGNKPNTGKVTLISLELAPSSRLASAYSKLYSLNLKQTIS